MTACPKCGTEMVAGLEGPGLVSCPNLCCVEPVEPVAQKVDAVAWPTSHDVAIEERLRLQAGTGGPPKEEPPKEEPPKEEPPKEEPPKEEPPVRVTPPRSRQ